VAVGVIKATTPKEAAGVTTKAALKVFYFLTTVAGSVRSNVADGGGRRVGGLSGFEFMATFFLSDEENFFTLSY